jgi:hypothetical protein
MGAVTTVTPNAGGIDGVDTLTDVENSVWN